MRVSRHRIPVETIRELLRRRSKIESTPDPHRMRIRVHQTSAAGLLVPSRKLRRTLALLLLLGRLLVLFAT